MLSLSQKESIETRALTMIGLKLASGYNSANTKILNKVKEDIKGNPGTFEKIFRKNVYDQGGEFGAKMSVDSIIYGDKYITNMNKYQDSLKPYRIHSIAMYLHDTGYTIEPDLITDNLAHKINSAAISFGYDTVVEESDEKDENKRLINFKSIPKNIDNVSDEDKAYFTVISKSFDLNQKDINNKMDQENFDDIHNYFQNFDKYHKEKYPIKKKKSNKPVRRAIPTVESVEKIMVYEEAEKNRIKDNIDKGIDIIIKTKVVVDLVKNIV